MTVTLDPKFAKVVRLMRSTTHEGERSSARAKAEGIARRCGMTFDEAVRLHDAAEAPRAARPKGAKAKGPASSSAGPHGFSFHDFDDWMEEKQPGWKAARAGENSAKVRAWRERRAAIVARYGSEAAALAPCQREQMILEAVARWRTVRAAPWQRWTDRLAGWHGYGFERNTLAPEVVAAIASAYPMPSTFAEARAEHAYWEARDAELQDMLDQKGTGYGDTALDMAAGVRADMVRDLAEKELPTATLADLHARFALYQAREVADEDIVAAMFRDLSAMVAREADGSAPVPEPAAPPTGNRPDLAGQIEASLTADASRSDRAIARALGCSPTTVGQVRGRMGLAGVRRSVQRGGQTYSMGGCSTPAGEAA